MPNTGRRSALRTSHRIKAVTDTNILVSGLMYSGNERKVLDLGVLGIIEIYLSQHIISELAGVLSRKFHVSEVDLAQGVAHIRRWARIVEPTVSVSLVYRNPADDRILECCLEANADYLITGDRRDLLPLGSFRGTSIVTALEFLNRFRGLNP